MSLDDVIAAGSGAERGGGRGGKAPRQRGGEDRDGDDNGHDENARSHARGRGGNRGGDRLPHRFDTATPYGVTHRQGQSVEDIAHAPAGERVLKVSATTDAKKLASSICLVCEHGDAPLLLPLGASSVNQAVKGVIIARRDLLASHTFLSCFPQMREGSRTAVCLQLRKELKQPWTSEDGVVDFTVKATTPPSSTAGAIAGKIREGLKVAIRACGADAVSVTVTAVAYAREYLEQDDTDIYFTAEFVKELVGGSNEERTIVLFRICRASEHGA